MAASNEITFQVPIFVPFLLVVSGHRRAELVERASPVTTLRELPAKFAAFVTVKPLPVLAADSPILLVLVGSWLRYLIAQLLLHALF